MKPERCRYECGRYRQVTVRLSRKETVRETSFEGTIIAKSMAASTKQSQSAAFHNVGCKGVFPVHSPTIVSSKQSESKVRRAKPTISEMSRKESKIKERFCKACNPFCCE